VPFGFQREVQKKEPPKAIKKSVATGAEETPLRRPLATGKTVTWLLYLAHKKSCIGLYPAAQIEI